MTADDFAVLAVLSTTNGGMGVEGYEVMVSPSGKTSVIAIEGGRRLSVAMINPTRRRRRIAPKGSDLFSGATRLSVICSGHRRMHTRSTSNFRAQASSALSRRPTHRRSRFLLIFC